MNMELKKDRKWSHLKVKTFMSPNVETLDSACDKWAQKYWVTEVKCYYGKDYHVRVLLYRERLETKPKEGGLI